MVFTTREILQSDGVLKEMHAIGTGRQRRLNNALRPKQTEVCVE